MTAHIVWDWVEDCSRLVVLRRQRSRLQNCCTSDWQRVFECRWNAVVWHECHTSDMTNRCLGRSDSFCMSTHTYHCSYHCTLIDRPKAGQLMICCKHHSKLRCFQQYLSYFFSGNLCFLWKVVCFGITGLYYCIGRLLALAILLLTFISVFIYLVLMCTWCNWFVLFCWLLHWLLASAILLLTFIPVFIYLISNVYLVYSSLFTITVVEYNIKNTLTNSVDWLTADMPAVCVELHDAIFVIGAVDEMLMLRGMRYHPIDIENSIVRSHRNICEWLVSAGSGGSKGGQGAVAPPPPWKFWPPMAPQWNLW